MGKLVFVNVLHSLPVYEKLPSQWNMNVKSLSFLKCFLVTFSVLTASGELGCPVFTMGATCPSGHALLTPFPCIHGLVSHVAHI